MGVWRYFNSHWLQYPWSSQTREYHITTKELLSIVLTAAVWGKHWENKSILCRCNNEAVVHIINTGTSKDPTAMGLMRCLYFIAAKFNLLLSATHLAGKQTALPTHYLVIMLPTSYPTTHRPALKQRSFQKQ